MRGIRTHAKASGGTGGKQGVGQEHTEGRGELMLNRGWRQENTETTGGARIGAGTHGGNAARDSLCEEHRHRVPHLLVPRWRGRWQYHEHLG